MPSARIPVKQITSWSYSRYQDYKQCPLKFKLKHIDKIQEPKNDAMVRGAELHNKAEDYIKGKVARLSPDLKLFKDEFKKLRDLYKRKMSGMIVEDTWAFTDKWTKTTWNDWVGCWVRIKLDCAHYEDDAHSIMVISDWKSGQFRPQSNEEYLEQLELYALGALLLHPHVEVVKPRLVYTDVGVVYPENQDEVVYTRADVAKLSKTWTKRVTPMMKDKIFAPRPNDKCRWCHFRKSNAGAGGGQCRY